MHEFVGIYCKLLLTFVGFITPITSILLSFFQQGINDLKAEYEEKASRYDKTIPGIKKGEKGDLGALRESTRSIRQQRRTLWFNKTRVRLKIWLLNPRKQTILLFSFLMISFFLASSTFLLEDGKFLGMKYDEMQWIIRLNLVISFILFLFVVGDLYLLTGVLIEVRKLSVTETTKEEEKDELKELLNLLEFRIGGSSIQDKHEEVIQVTAQKPLSAISLFNGSQEHPIGTVKLTLVFPHNKFDLSTSDSGAKVQTNKEGCTELNWEIDSLPCCDNVYMRSLKINNCAHGEYELAAFIEVEGKYSLKKSFKINVVPDEEVKK